MLLELTGIEKTFAARRGGASVKALRGVDLAVDRGEMIAIRGSSGAGKSTLLHIIGCLDRPTKGSYRLDGKDVVQESSARLAQIRNRTFGFVMQHFALVDEDSALQNAAIPLLSVAGEGARPAAIRPSGHCPSGAAKDRNAVRR